MLQQSSSIACHPATNGRAIGIAAACESLSIGGRDVGAILIGEGQPILTFLRRDKLPAAAAVVLAAGARRFTPAGFSSDT